LMSVSSIIVATNAVLLRREGAELEQIEDESSRGAMPQRARATAH